MSARPSRSAPTRRPCSRFVSAGSSAAWDDGIEDRRFHYELKKENAHGQRHIALAYCSGWSEFRSRSSCCCGSSAIFTETTGSGRLTSPTLDPDVTPHGPRGGATGSIADSLVDRSPEIPLHVGGARRIPEGLVIRTATISRTPPHPQHHATVWHAHISDRAQSLAPFWKEREVRLRLIDRTGEGRTSHQPVEISRHVLMG